MLSEQRRARCDGGEVGLIGIVRNIEACMEAYIAG
jgi:hypothetical protein